MTLIEEWTVARTAQACEDILMKAGVPCSRYASVAELLKDPELKAQGTFAEVSDGSGTFSVPRQPFRLSNSAVEVRRSVSDVGADCDAILDNVLGLSSDAIGDLKASGVVGS